MLRKIPKNLIYVVVIVAPFWLLFFNSPFWHGLKLKTMGAAASALSIVNVPLKEAGILLSYRKTYADHKKAQRENMALRARSVELDELRDENVRLTGLLGFKARQDFLTSAARVISRDPANWNSSMMISKGRAEGIRPGMPVINSLGVVGKVAEVAEHAAKVILVNDPGFSIAVVNQRSREAGLLSGSLTGKCRLSYLPEEADVKAGDPIVTSALSNAFPEGLLVGRVVNVYPAGGISDARAEVKPAVEVAKIEEVLVVK